MSLKIYDLISFKIPGINDVVDGYFIKEFEKEIMVITKYSEFDKVKKENFCYHQFIMFDKIYFKSIIKKHIKKRNILVEKTYIPHKSIPIYDKFYKIKELEDYIDILLTTPQLPVFFKIRPTLFNKLKYRLKSKLKKVYNLLHFW